jgi:hypothetical protein
MRIRPNYVPFEQAKLLKEKGFDVVCKSSYEYALTTKKDPEYEEGGPFGWKKGELNIEYDSEFLNGSESSDYTNKNWFMCARPEQWMVVEWLRVKHGIWVSLGMGENPVNFYPVIHDIKNKNIVDFKYHPPLWGETPEESYSAAIDHILKNII